MPSKPLCGYLKLVEAYSLLLRLFISWRPLKTLFYSITETQEEISWMAVWKDVRLHLPWIKAPYNAAQSTLISTKFCSSPVSINGLSVPKYMSQVGIYDCFFHKYESEIITTNFHVLFNLLFYYYLTPHGRVSPWYNGVQCIAGGANRRAWRKSLTSG